MTALVALTTTTIGVIGLVIAVVGFSILMGSLIAERMEQRQREGDLLDDDQNP